MEKKIGNKKVRYLSSNRIGGMEQYRSRINQYSHSASEYQVGTIQTKAARHEIETSTGDFFTMDERKDIYIKVAERLSVLFNRNIYLRWEAGSLKVFFEKTETQKEYSVAAEASGLINIISILAALYDEEIQVLLIDEPEVSLHPQLQSYLLREIRTAIEKYGKTVVLSTHSAEMISFNKVKDIHNFVFFSEKKTPVQVPQDALELKDKKLKEFLLRMGQVYKNGFFAKRVLLIEGASDMLICQFLANKLEYNIDVAGSQIIPVDGKGQFPVITKLFRLINKEVAILTDLDGFIDDNNIVELFSKLPEGKDLASEKGVSSISEMATNVKSALVRLIQKNKSNIQEIYKVHPYWINKKAHEDEDKVEKRAVVGQLFCMPNADIESWVECEEWIRLKNRINAIFALLSEMGCFVLKKGAIESYYQYASDKTYNEKPSAAVEEISYLIDKDKNDIEEDYKDIVDALKYIASTEEIDESFAIKKELLSELALVLGMLTSKTSEKEIYAAIKQAKNDGISMFEYKIFAENEKIGVEVDLHSNIIAVSGFPFKIYKGQNVNELVELYINKN